MFDFFRALAISCNAQFNSEKGAESKDWKKGKPIRVVRSCKSGKHSKYAPKDGIRYDGIYKVVKYFREKGKSGFYVWRYFLRRDDPVPAPWEAGEESPLIVSHFFKLLFFNLSIGFYQIFL